MCCDEKIFLYGNLTGVDKIATDVCGVLLGLAWQPSCRKQKEMQPQTKVWERYENSGNSLSLPAPR